MHFALFRQRRNKMPGFRAVIEKYKPKDEDENEIQFYNHSEFKTVSQKMRYTL